MLSCINFPRRVRSVVSLFLIYTLTSLLVPGCGPEHKDAPLEPRSNSGTSPNAVIEPTPLPTAPSVAAQEDFITRLLDDAGYVDGDENIADYFISEYYTPLSDQSKATLALWSDEWQANGMLVSDFDERWDEFTVPQTPAWAALEAEMVPLWDFTVGDPGKFLGALIAVVVAVVAAMANSYACQQDALDNQIACFHQECPQGQQADLDCCTDEAKEDIWNCFLSGGTNGPDPEYNSNCCKAKIRHYQHLENH
jgi:hypothetical protein